MSKKNLIFKFVVISYVFIYFPNSQAAETACCKNAEPKTIQVSVVEPAGTQYSTFQSHNQKVVSNDNGIFMTYLYYCDDANDEKDNIWRLMQSTDDGKTFKIVHQATFASRAPALETDSENNIYLAFPDYHEEDDPFYFYTFLASEDYKTPHVSKQTGIDCDGKYSMTLDEKREQFYIATQYGELLTLDKKGKMLRRSQVLKQRGQNAASQYPLLKMDTRGNLHHAWTSALLKEYGYWDIHHMLSKDGGLTWENLNHKPMTTPTEPDDWSKAELIISPDEFTMQTWLANMLPKDKKLHFFYQAIPVSKEDKNSNKATRQHYIRYDLETGKREIDIYKDNPDRQWRGEKIALVSVDGFFAANTQKPGSPLYAIGHDIEGYLAALVTYNEGSTWEDFAKSENNYYSYAIGGCSKLTKDGKIIGSFFDQKSKTVNFFSINTK